MIVLGSPNFGPINKLYTQPKDIMFILVTTSRTIHVSKYHTPKKKEKGVPMVGGEFQKIKNSDYDYLYIDF